MRMIAPSEKKQECLEPMVLSNLLALVVAACFPTLSARPMFAPWSFVWFFLIGA